jgi:predicted lipoprotein with Yx(FWY)xxD motif
MKKSVIKKTAVKFCLLLMFSAFVVGCSSDDDGYNDPDPGPNVENSVRLSSDATFGSVLTDSDGFTLYFFAPDAKGNANCLDGCADIWPAFFAENLTIDAGLDQSDFATITRTDGQTQTTYKGWPLYTFANDAQAGEINGDGAGGTWFVGKPDYSVMLVRSQLVGRDSNGIETNLNSSFEPGDEDTFYITDDRGNTLYHFSNDESANNTFTASDFSNNAVWPIFHAELQSVPSALSANGFGVINVFGESQMTYKGWPLYNFGGDENRGDNFGVGFPVAGVWPILNLDTELAPEGIVTPDQVFEITNVGASAYQFDFTDIQNPELELTRGNTYEFNVNSPGHPFFIKSVESTGTDNAFNDGVTNNGTANGTILFTVPNDAPDILFYNCEFHASMTGRIRVVNQDETSSFDVTNNGATSYVFAGNGFSDAENTNFTFKRGSTYTFIVATPGHPFIIKSVQGNGTGNAFNDGVTNNGISDGTITFQVPENAPDTLFYNCEFHGTMTGTITIID